MKIEKAKLSCYSRYGSAGQWEIDVWFADDPERHIRIIGERPLMKACGSTRRGTFTKPQTFLNTDEGKVWLQKHLEESS